MEIDCLICGHIGMCTFVNCTATIQDNYNDNDCSNNQEKSKWSKCFCELLDVNAELVPEIQGILQFSYYCNHCIPDLQFIYETFCEIEALRESLNSKRDEYKVKLGNASLKCNGAERNHTDPSRQFENVTTTSDDKDFDLKVLVDEFDFHPSPNSPSQTLSRDKLLKCLKKDLAEPSLPKLDHESDNKGKNQNQQPWTSSSTNTFEDEYCSPLENISILTPETVDFESESDQGGMLEKSCLGNTDTGISKTIKRTLKPKRLQIKANKSTEVDIIISDDDEQESSQSNGLRSQSRRAKIQNYSKLNLNSDSDDGPCKDSSESRASSEEYNSDCDDPDYSVEEDLSKKDWRRKRNSKRKDLFLPTVLSDQDTIKSIELLEKEYDELIKYYGIKKLRIPVMKLPDDDSGSESENIKIDCKCPIIDCKTRFLRKFKLIKHIRVVHRGIKCQYECKICNKTFRRTFDYREHLNIHSNSLPYSCPDPDCDYKFPTRKRLLDHKRLRHSLTKFQCDQCGKFFPTQYIYQVHLRRHSSDRPFVCEVCGKSYKFPYDLQYHRTLHPELNLKQFKCEVCGKIFSHAQGLKQHMKGHTGNLPFLCDKCDFRASSASLLKSHMNRHTEGKPYECEVCHAKYKSRNGLSVHRKFDCGTDKDSKNFVCEECGKGFCTIIRLRHHKKIHTIVGKPFLCYICGSSYTKKQNLERHHTTCHKELETESTFKNTTDDVSGPAPVPVPLLPEMPSVEDRSEGQL